MTLKEFRELTKDLPEETKIMYHSWNKGCSLSSYDKNEFWIFEQQAVVINPGGDYDGRKPNKC